MIFLLKIAEFKVISSQEASLLPIGSYLPTKLLGVRGPTDCFISPLPTFLSYCNKINKMSMLIHYSISSYNKLSPHGLVSFIPAMAKAEK